MARPSRLGDITKLIKNELRINTEKASQQSDEKNTVDTETPVDTDKTEPTESPKKDTDTNE